MPNAPKSQSVTASVTDEDTPKPWDQQQGEPNAWFERFTLYRLLGAKRSLHAAFMQERARAGARGREKQGLPGAWRKHSKRWNWHERASAFDDYLRAQEEAEWLERRREVRARDWEIAQALRDKAKQMLEYPLAVIKREAVSADGKTTNVTNIHPARWGVSDAARMADIGSKIARLAAEMATSIEEQRTKPKTADEMTDDELAAIIAEGRSDSGSPDPSQSPPRAQ